MFIGFYNYTVVLTYMSLLSSVVGMTEALDGRFGNAIACLVASGICDMLDGKVARTKKDRTEDEKNFGIQIDSLCDLFCFGAFPAFLTYALGVRGLVGTVSMCVYVLAAVIRLGYFNVKEMRRQQETEERRKRYEGLPVTSISIIFPLIYLLRPYLWSHGLSSDPYCSDVCGGVPFREQDPCPETGKRADVLFYCSRSGDPWKTVTYLLRKET